jgi:hypothetical protein
MNIKAGLRNGELQTLQLRIQHTLQTFIAQAPDGITRCCINCQHFDESGQLTGRRDTCTKANPPQTPPARIVAFGCPMHADLEDIPF